MLQYNHKHGCIVLLLQGTAGEHGVGSELLVSACPSVLWVTEWGSLALRRGLLCHRFDACFVVGTLCCAAQCSPVSCSEAISAEALRGPWRHTGTPFGVRSLTHSHRGHFRHHSPLLVATQSQMLAHASISHLPTATGHG